MKSEKEKIFENHIAAHLLTFINETQSTKYQKLKENYSTDADAEYFDELFVDYARKKKAIALVRGVRAVSDFEYELQMALMNRKLADDISTIFFMHHEKHTYLNSSIVREIAKLDGDISNFVPAYVQKILKSKVRQLKL
ncbi:MAG: pantetheine-phosphate adenylyltransferase [Bacteroidota bacterium]|nr:pantetheine-phosphate adenylyltransferase [Bacteroidota bacterium]